MKLFCSMMFMALCSMMSLAQSSKLTVRPKYINEFVNALSSSTLIVTIHYLDDPEELELIEAVNKYWKATPIKFITVDEFKKEHSGNWTSQTKYLYLIKAAYNSREGKRDSRFIKYFISRATNGVEMDVIPRLEFKVPSKLNGDFQEVFNYQYLYDLMMKHFAYEAQYLKDTKNYNAVTKQMLLSSGFKHNLKEYANREIWMSPRELENYLMKVPIEYRTDHEALSFRKFIARKTNARLENIKIMTDYDIEAVVDTCNTGILVYTGYSIYKPEDGKMLRRIDPNRGRKIAKGIIGSICTVGFLSLVIGVLATYEAP